MGAAVFDCLKEHTADRRQDIPDRRLRKTLVSFRTDQFPYHRPADFRERFGAKQGIDVVH
jgi:hypothetical protein